MNIVQEKKDNLHSIIKVEVIHEDYRDKVAAEMKNIQRKAQMPGFRPGKVPPQLVQKMYGRGVLVDEVNKLLQESLHNYIKENNLDILGSPLPEDEGEKIDWDTQKDFVFSYEIGLAPKVTIELSEEIEVEYHHIAVDKQMVDNYALEIRNRNGRMINPELSGESDVLIGEFLEMEAPGVPKNDGHKHSSNLYIKYIQQEDVRNNLTNIAVGAVVELDVLAAVGNNETEAASMLGLKKEELANYNSLFSFRVEKISRLEPAELNEELYKKAFPESEIVDEEGFMKIVEENISKQYQSDSDKHFRNEAMKKLLDIAQLELPEAFLKKWIQVSGKEPLTEEQAELEYDKLADPFRWQLIENHIIRTYGVDVSIDEVREFLSDYYRNQLKQYGMEDVDQVMVDKFVSRIFENQEELKKVYDDLFANKLLALFKEKIKLNKVETTYEDFTKLVLEKYQAEKSR